MKKRLLIIGCSMFEDIIIEKNKFVPTYRSTAIKLASDYIVDNFSLKKMTASRALQLINCLPQIYDSCILALGEADLGNSANFKTELYAIVNRLKSNLIKPILVALPPDLSENADFQKIQDAIIEVADNCEVDLIYGGQISTKAYQVNCHDDYQTVIKSLC